MAWTSPKTWADDDVPTATEFNQQLRDNFTLLKTVRDSAGRLSGLNSSTLADLSAANVTGLVAVGAANAFSAGRTRFLGTARVVVPVGADKWAGTKGVDAGGSVWVEGDYLHHIASNHTTEYRYLGTLVGACVGTPGSLWVEGNDLHYVDEDGDERYCIFSGTTAVHTDAAALGGSPWVETYIHWIRETGSVEKPGHADVTHSDHSDYNDHTDHSDSGPHTDHSDHLDGDYTPHEDNEPPHEDHQDYVYVDIEYGDHTDHGDYTDHGDTGTHDDYSDHGDSTPHGDVSADSRPVVVS